MPSARERPDPALVATIRELLDHIGAAEGRENDELEEIVEAAAEEFAALQGPGLVPALLKASGRSTARRAWLTRDDVANTLPWAQFAPLRKRAQR